MKKNSDAGWYHYSDMDGFNGIEYLPTGITDQVNYGDYKHRQSAHGPFKTFGEAKKDAIDFWQTDINIARMRIWEIREWKKVDSFYKGNE